MIRDSFDAANKIKSIPSEVFDNVFCFLIIIYKCAASGNYQYKFRPCLQLYAYTYST